MQCIAINTKIESVRSAVPYVQAIDVFQDILKEENIRAIIGGHSKRAFYTYNAAAIDPERVASVIYMGCEALYTDIDKYPPSVNPVYIQDFVKCPILYIGGTDEGGYEETAEGTIFRAHIDTPNKIIQAKLWYVYCDDVPYWRDLVWYPVLMQNKVGTLFEGHVEGILPDAWLVEVKDIAKGTAGYISSLPQDITHKETRVRIPFFSGARLWKPIQKKK